MSWGGEGGGPATNKSRAISGLKDVRCLSQASVNNMEYPHYIISTFLPLNLPLMDISLCGIPRYIDQDHEGSARASL